VGFFGVRIVAVFLRNGRTQRGEEKDRQRKKMGVEREEEDARLPRFGTGRAERHGFGAGNTKSASFGTSHAKRGGPRLPLRRPTCSSPVSVLAMPKQFRHGP